MIGDPATTSRLDTPPLPASAAEWALLLDIDGTIVGFRSRPHEVTLSDETREVLGRLHAQLGGALAILSGRSLADVDRLCAPLRVAAGALHGAQHRDARGTIRVMRAPEAVTGLVARDCLAAEQLWPGVRVEDKEGISFALHFRDAPAVGDAVRRFAQSIARESNGAFVAQFGDCVAELKPQGPTKGRSLAALLGSPPFAGRRPVAVGDDLTDELAFAEAALQGGFGVIVGPRRPTLARFALATPDDTLAWLRAISRALES